MPRYSLRHPLRGRLVHGPFDLSWPFASRALTLQRTLLTGLGPITSQLLALISYSVTQAFARRTNIHVFMLVIAERRQRKDTFCLPGSGPFHINFNLVSFTDFDLGGVVIPPISTHLQLVHG